MADTDGGLLMKGQNAQPGHSQNLGDNRAALTVAFGSLSCLHQFPGSGSAELLGFGMDRHQGMVRLHGAKKLQERAVVKGTVLSGITHENFQCSDPLPDQFLCTLRPVGLYPSVQGAVHN